LPALAARFGLPDEVAVLGSFIADANALQRFAAAAPLNTDDRPWVAYRAPRILGRRTAPSADPAVMLARVGPPLLAVLRQSPDFQPAAEPLRRLAQALAPRDPAATQALIAALHDIRPDLAALP
jgi:spermidine synthase